MQKIFYDDSHSKLFKSHKIRFILTSRLSGSSKSPYESLNLGYHTGDNQTFVRANRQSIMLEFFPNKTLLWLNQIHSNRILESKIIKSKSVRHKLKNTEILLGNGDGILCADSRFVALVMVADCNPILIYDPKLHIFCLLHAGRAGVCLKILTKALQKMHALGSQTNDLLIFIGASIRVCCYEISQDLAKDIASKFSLKYLIKRDNRIFLDLIAMLKDECQENGIDSTHIEILPVCSCCEENLFSYRRESITGRFGLFASLE